MSNALRDGADDGQRTSGKREEQMMSDLIRREDAIKVAKSFLRNDDEWFQEALASQIRMIPSADRPQEWILCSERLPESDYMCLVSCKTKKGVKSVNRAYYSDGYWHGSGSMSGVEAWMPLPKPWKGADDERA